MTAIESVPAADAPTIPGTPFAGGFYVGRYRDQHDGQERALITSGRAGELVGAWGEYGQDVPGAISCTDGYANTLAMAEAGSDVARRVVGMQLNGCNDWCIPARDQRELLYRYLKPTTAQNSCTLSDGDNPSSIPAGYPYTPESPAQTAAEAFLDGGPEAFAPAWYWSSTQYSPDYAYGQDFADGSQGNGGKANEARVRPVRSVRIDAERNPLSTR